MTCHRSCRELDHLFFVGSVGLSLEPIAEDALTPSLRFLLEKGEDHRTFCTALGLRRSGVSWLIA